jgi:hypothetical protein
MSKPENATVPLGAVPKTAAETTIEIANAALTALGRVEYLSVYSSRRDLDRATADLAEAARLLAQLNLKAAAE